MRPTNRHCFAATGFILLCLLLQGCTTERSIGSGFLSPDGSTGRTSFTEPQKSMIAQDLVFVLTRLKEFPTRITTLQMVAPTTPFGKRVLEQLRLAGYGLQFVDGDHGQHFVRFRGQTAETEFGVKWEYRLGVGDVQLKREYRLIDNSLVPASEVYISGTDPQGVVPNDSQFESARLNPAHSQVVTAGRALVAEIIELKPGRQLITAQVTPQTNDSASGADNLSARASNTTSSGLLGVAQRNNVYQTQESNFAVLFKDYKSVRREVLNFAKDSIQIGVEQENTIESLAKAFKQDEHVISVVGYSHGRSAIRNGNQKLAEGRSEEVRNMLIAVGVDPQRVFFEASWSSNPNRTVQWRSVVVKLLQRR